MVLINDPPLRPSAHTGDRRSEGNYGIYLLNFLMTIW